MLTTEKMRYQYEDALHHRMEKVMSLTVLREITMKR